MDKLLTKQVVIRMPKHMSDALKADAKKHDRSMAQTVRRAINLYLWEQTERDIFLREEK